MLDEQALRTAIDQWDKDISKECKNTRSIYGYAGSFSDPMTVFSVWFAYVMDNRDELGVADVFPSSSFTLNDPANALGGFYLGIGTFLDDYVGKIARKTNLPADFITSYMKNLLLEHDDSSPTPTEILKKSLGIIADSDAYTQGCLKESPDREEGASVAKTIWNYYRIRRLRHIPHSEALYAIAKHSLPNHKHPTSAACLDSSRNFIGELIDSGDFDTLDNVLLAGSQPGSIFMEVMLLWFAGFKGRIEASNLIDLRDSNFGSGKYDIVVDYIQSNRRTFSYQPIMGSARSGTDEHTNPKKDRLSISLRLKADDGACAVHIGDAESANEDGIELRRYATEQENLQTIIVVNPTQDSERDNTYAIVVFGPKPCKKTKLGQLAVMMQSRIRPTVIDTDLLFSTIENARELDKKRILDEELVLWKPSTYWGYEYEAARDLNEIIDRIRLASEKNTKNIEALQALLAGLENASDGESND